MSHKSPGGADAGGASPYDDDVERAAHEVKVRSADTASKVRERYVRAFSRPGAMRAGFELYRAFPVNVERNWDDLKRDGKLTMPVLALPGAASAFAPFTEGMMREVAKDVTFRTIERANHWVPEENAKALVSAITDFL